MNKVVRMLGNGDFQKRINGIKIAQVSIKDQISEAEIYLAEIEAREESYSEIKERLAKCEAVIISCPNCRGKI